MKKYALNNSYFKYRNPGDPDTPAEVVNHLLANGELPFRYDGENWPYDMVCERQKRRGVIHCQHLTPDDAAERMAHLAHMYATQTNSALDACCGTGQITKMLMGDGFEVCGFDIDPDMMAVYNYLYPHNEGETVDFDDLKDRRYELVVSNPPFDREIAPRFMAWLAGSMAPRGIAVLLLLEGYVDKDKPKALVQTLSCFRILTREPVTAKFAHTNTMCEVVVLEKIDGEGR